MNVENLAPSEASTTNVQHNHKARLLKKLPTVGSQVKQWKKV